MGQQSSPESLRENASPPPGHAPVFHFPRRCKRRAIFRRPSGAKISTTSSAAHFYNAGGFAAINSTKRLSLRNSANSASLYTLLKSLYPASSAFFRYSSDRSA